MIFMIKFSYNCTAHSIDLFTVSNAILVGRQTQVKYSECLDILQTLKHSKSFKV